MNSMSNETIITLLVALIGAFGVKEIWVIWKKKIDIKARKDESTDNKLSTLYMSIIQDLKVQIQKLENKVDLLINENVELRQEISNLENALKPTSRYSTRKRKSDSETKPE
jgi:regulator of replication initiation timing